MDIDDYKPEPAGQDLSPPQVVCPPSSPLVMTPESSSSEVAASPAFPAGGHAPGSVQASCLDVAFRPAAICSVSGLLGGGGERAPWRRRPADTHDGWPWN